MLSRPTFSAAERKSGRIPFSVSPNSRMNHRHSKQRDTEQAKRVEVARCLPNSSGDLIQATATRNLRCEATPRRAAESARRSKPFRNRPTRPAPRGPSAQGRLGKRGARAGGAGNKTRFYATQQAPRKRWLPVACEPSSANERIKSVLFSARGLSARVVTTFVASIRARNVGAYPCQARASR